MCWVRRRDSRSGRGLSLDTVITGSGTRLQSSEGLDGTLRHLHKVNQKVQTALTCKYQRKN